MRTTLIAGATILSLAVGLVLWSRIRDEKDRQAIKPYVTWTRLMYLAEGCDKYRAQYGRWPDSLAQLQKGRPELVDPWDKDAWGRQIVIVPYDKSTSYGELISYGRDGKAGGVDDDRDLVIRFPCEANTNWNAQIGAGLKQPRFNP
jgi:hypothetical protein